MPSRYVWWSHLARLSEVSRRTEEDMNQRPKRLDEEDNTVLAILVDVPCTLTEQSIEVKND